MKRLILNILLGKVLASCASTGKLSEPVALPVEVEQYFRPCNSFDGAFNARAYKDKGYIGASDVEWVSDANGFEFQIQDPIARALLVLQIHKSDDHVTLSGPLAESLPDVQVRDGFLQVDGYFVGVKPDELGCYLAGYIPFHQTRNVRSITRKNSDYLLSIEDSKRSIEVHIQGHNTADVKICSRITWSAVLGLVKRDMIICSDRLPARAGRISLLDQYSLQWEILE